MPLQVNLVLTLTFILVIELFLQIPSEGI
jgi:hypothetical protein